MSVAKSASLTLEEFLKLPETKPASIYIDGEIIQKPMPKTRHSRLQAKFAPNWTIEILSPDQSSNRVTSNILHCLKYGYQLGWLIDPDDRSVLVFKSHQQPEFCHREDRLPVLDGIDLELTGEQVFGWLKMNA
ncbi:MAG: Uma2 family endonuclease [Nostoc sp.]|uniref:Uma2 family endonuclease n=1 Tax=Nostoc sp. TaxID=1180 RepID=UPI002FF51653